MLVISKLPCASRRPIWKLHSLLLPELYSTRSNFNTITYHSRLLPTNVRVSILQGKIVLIISEKKIDTLTLSVKLNHFAIGCSSEFPASTKLFTGILTSPKK